VNNSSQGRNSVRPSLATDPVEKTLGQLRVSTASVRLRGEGRHDGKGSDQESNELHGDYQTTSDLEEMGNAMAVV
jgi:hypothetical protein